MQAIDAGEAQIIVDQICLKQILTLNWTNQIWILKMCVGNQINEVQQKRKQHFHEQDTFYKFNHLFCCEFQLFTSELMLDLHWLLYQFSLLIWHILIIDANLCHAICFVLKFVGPNAIEILQTIDRGIYLDFQDIACTTIFHDFIRLLSYLEKHRFNIGWMHLWDTIYSMRTIRIIWVI